MSVDTWLKSAMNQVMEELENERWAMLPSLTTHDAPLSVSYPHKWCCYREEDRRSTHLLP